MFLDIQVIQVRGFQAIPVSVVLQVQAAILGTPGYRAILVILGVA